MLLSLAILGAAGYLLWTWWDGYPVRQVDGDFDRLHEDWRLWTGLALLAWSFLGRFVATVVLARPDATRVDWRRSSGRMVQSRTGSSLYVESHGAEEGPVIIFTHGWGMDSTFWSYAKRDLAERLGLVVWDLPGLGRSKATSGSISLSAFAQDLATLIEAAGSRPALLVGHSIGGMTIQTLIRDNPQIEARLAGVVLLNTTYTNPLSTMVLSGLLRALQRPLLEPAAHLTIWLSPLVWLFKWQSYLSGSTHVAMRLGFGGLVSRSQLEHASLLSTRASPAVEARGDLAMFHWNAAQALRDLKVPVLVIGGDKDIVTKLEASRVIADEAGLATLRIVQDANHMGPLERADLYNAMIADFAFLVADGGAPKAALSGKGLAAR